MMNSLILIAEDDAEIADIIRAYFEREGFRIVHAPDGRVALDLHLALKPDLILLDVSMPRVDGWEVLSNVRQRSDTPIIMLTALDQDIDKLQALRIGADDYVVKPFNVVEVVARAKAVLRRAAGDRNATVLRAGHLEIDQEAHEVRKIEEDGSFSRVSLTVTEFRLLVHLARNPHRVFSRGELVDACLPGAEPLDRTVDSHISKLKRKLAAVGLIDMPASIRGVGYRLISS